MKLRWLIALGAVTYILFAIVTFPASVLLERLRDQGVTAAGVEGTAWKGRAQLLKIKNENVGSVEWDLHALALLTLRLSADVKVTRMEGFMQSQIELGRESVRFAELTASVPLTALRGIAPPGWQGTANLKFAELVLENDWPTSANGTVELMNLESTRQRSPISGSYKLTFPAPNAESSEGTLRGALTDLDGPLKIDGTIELRPNRSYLLSGLVAAKPDAPRNLVNQLQILGPADEQGRRPFSLEGTL